jgi:hypothetical protein
VRTAAAQTFAVAGADIAGSADAAA